MATPFGCTLEVIQGHGVNHLVLFLQLTLFLVFASGLVLSQLGYTILGRVLARGTARRADQGMFLPPK